MVHPAYKKFWSTHPAAAVQDRLFAEEEQKIAVPQSTVAAWLLMPPSASFVTGLSASAIEIFEECPLRFKLEREWNLPRDVPASLHYGAAMHGVLRTFYDAQRYERAVGDDDLLEQFRTALASAGIADRYQYELYLGQGMEQLRQFFEGARSAEPPEVIETESRFELQVGSAKLSGAWIASIARGRTRLPSWTTRRASRSRRRMPTRACNFPCMRSRRGRLGESVPTA